MGKSGWMFYHQFPSIGHLAICSKAQKFLVDHSRSQLQIMLMHPRLFEILPIIGKLHPVPDFVLPIEMGIVI